LWHLVHHVTSLVVVLLSVVVVSHWSTSVHVHLLSSSLVHLLIHGLVLLNKGEDLLNDLSQVWVRVQIVPLESTRLLGL